MTNDDKQGIVVISRNGRYKAEISSTVVIIIERTMKGTLVTTVDKSVGVLDQEYIEKADALSVLKSRLPMFTIKLVNEMQRTGLDKKCKKCGAKLYRELESVDPSLLDNVPAVPMFRCESCGSRYYSMTNEYLSKLVDRNNELFSEDELHEIRKDREKGIALLNEYIIRIFASKKISRA